MKKTNKLISILLVAVMLLSMAPLSLTASAADIEVYATGTLGSGSRTAWTIYDNGLLVIDGKGNSVSTKWDSTTASPWKDYADIITRVSFVNCENWECIPECTFRSLSKLKDVTLPKNIEEICQYAFTGTAIETILLPDGLITIGYYAFSSCESLKYININDGVTSIGSSAFYNCSSLKAISIPDSVTSIGQTLFQNCTNLEYVRLSENADKVGGSMFSGCTMLKNVSLPASVTVIGSKAFSNASNLEGVYYHGINEPTTYNPGINNATFSLAPDTMVIYASNDYSATTMGLKANWENDVQTVTKIEGHFVNIAHTANGAVKVGASIVPAGDTVTIDIMAYKNYELDTITVTDSNGQVELSGSGHSRTFSMPEGDVRISATFKSTATPHVHSWTYSANGATITATCAYADTCHNPISKVEISKGNTSSLTFRPDNAKYMTVSGTMEDVVIPDLVYTLKSTGEPTTPINPGVYVASLTIENVTATYEFEITRGNFNYTYFTYTAPQNLTYDGTPKYASVVMSEDYVPYAGEYTVYYNSGTTEPINAGTYTVKVNVAESDYFTAGTAISGRAWRFTIAPKSIEDLTYEGLGTSYPVGATLDVIIKHGDMVLVKDTDYTVEYANNTELGTATMTVTGVGNYTGSKTLEFEIVPHTHSFTYSASGDTITAVCANTDGNCPDSEGTLTILAPANLYADGTAKEATIENNLVDTSVAISDITYSAPYGLPPKDAGTYTASVTVGGATASVQFTLLNYAAKVTDKDGNELEGSPYKTFAAAVRAAEKSEGSTVTLLDDITLSSTQYVYSGTFTLDLNGKTLLNETAAAISIESDADVTIKDSSEGSIIESKTQSSKTIYNYGTLTVESGIIKGDGGIDNRGTLNFKNGKIEADKSQAIINFGTAYIHNGILESSSNDAIISNPDATIYVYGGEFSGSAGIVNHGTAFIEGGEFTGKSYAALNLLGGTVEVTGGSFTGTDFASGYYSGTPYGEYTVYCNEGATLILKGGEFPNGFVVAYTTANAFLAEGYAFYDKDGNKITVADDAKIIDGYVQVKEHFVASVTDKDGNELSGSPYKTFADAITAAQGSEDSTLTLLDDIILTTRQDISSGKFTLDLNGNNLVNETDSVFYIYEEVDLTIKDSGENGTVETKRMYVDCIVNNGKLTVESGIIKGDGGIRNYGVLFFNDGTVEADFFAAITNYSSGSVYVYDGVLKGSKNSGAVDNNGTLYIYGGEIKGIANSNTAYISGGTIDRDDYAALNLLGGTLEVTGGSFTGTDNEYGDYSGTPFGEWTVCYTEGATLTLKGGEFPNGFVVANTTANTFLAEDYYYKDADGKLIDVADDAKIINGYVKVSKGADLADAVITLDETQFTYSGVEHKPTVIVTVGGKTLTEGKDYTLTFANNVNAGTATVTIKAISQAAGGIAGGGENIGNSSNSGDITESVYTGEVTKEFTINKKPVTVTATAPDKAYDGTSDIDVSEIVITFDGIVEGDTVGYTIKDAWFNGIVVGTDWPVPIVYNVTGEDANNYTFPAGGEYIAPDYFVEATADITAKDISDGFIILGDALTYNGKEQTQTVEKVIPTGTAPEATYTVSGNKATNVGVYLLTVTGTGNFTGEAKIAYEIAPDVECISHLDRVEDNGVMKWNVKSTDRESLEYVIDQLNNAVTDIADDDTKNEWADTKEACEDMLRIINSIELAIADVEEDYAGFSEDTVKSSDIPALDEIVSKVNEIKDRYGFNLTDEEAKRLEDILDGIEKLKAKIAETAEEIERIDEAVNGYDKETVTSDDIPELGKLIEDIKALTDGDNITEDEKAALEEADEAIDELVEKLAEVAEESKRVDEAVKSYDEETVKSTDSEDLAQLKEDIQTLIDSTNTTENEKNALEEMIKDIEGLEDKITETEEKLEEIKDIESNFNPETVTSDDKAAIEDKIAEIEAVNPDNLTDEQREEYEEIKAGFEALLEEIAEAEKNVADIGTQLEMFDEERVTKFCEDDIEALKAKIDELLADENMGEAEKAKLNEYKAQAEKLIEIINDPCEYFSLRFFYLIWDCLMWKYNGILGLFTK